MHWIFWMWTNTALTISTAGILLTMIEKFQGGPVGLDTLAAAVSEDAGTLEDVYEPYLLKNGFIQRTPRGRVVTALGIPSSWESPQPHKPGSGSF